MQIQSQYHFYAPAQSMMAEAPQEIYATAMHTIMQDLQKKTLNFLHNNANNLQVHTVQEPATNNTTQMQTQQLNHNPESDLLQTEDTAGNTYADEEEEDTL